MSIFSRFTILFWFSFRKQQSSEILIFIQLDILGKKVKWKASNHWDLTACCKAATEFGECPALKLMSVIHREITLTAIWLDLKVCIFIVFGIWNCISNGFTSLEIGSERKVLSPKLEPFVVSLLSFLRLKWHSLHCNQKSQQSYSLITLGFVPKIGVLVLRRNYTQLGLVPTVTAALGSMLKWLLAFTSLV